MPAAPRLEHVATSTIEPRLVEILSGAAVFRVLTVAWTLAVTVIDARSGVLGRPLVASIVVAVLVVWSATVGISSRSRPEMLIRPATIALDMTVAAMTIATDSIVYSGAHPQSFGSAWPVIAVASTASILGWIPGLWAGFGVGIVNIIAMAVMDRLDGRILAAVGTLLLMATTGAVAGLIADRLRRADSTVEAAKAREEFARTLHDGVLQTLAVIQRRSDDAHLVELAREQEWDLRRFIDQGASSKTDLVDTLRQTAARVERHHDVRVSVVVIEAPRTDGTGSAALAGAAAEAMTNAAKHANASRITVCVDRDDGRKVVTVTVNDDGDGFDVDRIEPGTGISRSIKGRIEESGGQVTIRSWPGRGTEVEMWAP